MNNKESNMKLNEYVKGAVSTESKIDVAQVNKTELMTVLDMFVATGNIMDMLKKNIFYGREIDYGKYEDYLDDISKLSTMLNQILESPVPKDNIDEVDPRILHGIVGMATESTELVEALVKNIKTGELDSVNVAEEMGDTSWYYAILVDALGLDWENILITNNKKLTAIRYKNGFNAEDAINRDIDKEREILEK